MFVVERYGLVDIGGGRRDEENCDIDEIRGFTYHSVIGVENYRYESESQKQSSELYAMEATVAAKE